MSTIDSSDRGLAYGDGLFETIAYVKNCPHNWDLHWQRLTSGCEQLKINPPHEHRVLSLINNKLEQYCSSHDSGIADNNAIIKIIVTRGKGGRGYLFPEAQESTLIVSVHTWPERPDSDYLNGINAVVCETRLAQQPALAGLKHLNRLEQVLARNEFSTSCYQEGIMLSYSDRLSLLDSLLIEGTSSNLFFVSHGQLLTAKIDTCGVLGTIRQAVIQLAQQQGLDLVAGDYPLHDLQGAKEVFFTNSVFGIVPVASITVTKNMQWHFRERAISTQLAACINKELQRPYQFNGI